MPFPGAEFLDSCGQSFATSGPFLVLGQFDVMGWRWVDKPFESITPFVVTMNLCIQRYVTTQATIHIHDITFRYFQSRRDRPDLLGPQIPILEG